MVASATDREPSGFSAKAISAHATLTVEKGVGANRSVVVQSLDNWHAFSTASRKHRGRQGVREAVDMNNAWFEVSNRLSDIFEGRPIPACIRQFLKRRYAAKYIVAKGDW